MKKILALLMVVVVLFSTLSFSTSNARAAGTVTYQGGVFIVGKGVTFVFKASGFKNSDVRGASIFAGSNFHNLYCSVNKGAGKIVCVAGSRLTEYGGETGIIHLAGQIFYVTIPRTNLLEGGCDEEEVLGSNVRFEDHDGNSSTVFVPGQDLQEVAQVAKKEAALNELAGYQMLSTDIYCNSVEVEEEEAPEEGPSVASSEEAPAEASEEEAEEEAPAGAPEEEPSGAPIDPSEEI